MNEDHEQHIERPPMIQCIYASASTVSFSQEDLTRLLSIARENNTRLGVTGMLLYHDTSFFQVLEGDPDQVHSIFNRIKDDTRHSQVVKIIEEPIDDRHFGDWSMGYTGISSKELSEIPGLNDFYSTRNCFTQLESGRARALLEQFSLGSWRQKLETPAA